MQILDSFLLFCLKFLVEIFDSVQYVLFHVLQRLPNILQHNHRLMPRIFTSPAGVQLSVKNLLDVATLAFSQPEHCLTNLQPKLRLIVRSGLLSPRPIQLDSLMQICWLVSIPDRVLLFFGDGELLAVHDPFDLFHLLVDDVLLRRIEQVHPIEILLHPLKTLLSLLVLLRIEFLLLDGVAFLLLEFLDLLYALVLRPFL